MADRGATREFWMALFDERPDVLHQLLGDIYLITKAHRDEPRGGRRRGKSGEGNLGELLGMITPVFSNKPFPESVRDLMRGQSIRAFAGRVGVHHELLRRLLTGQRTVSLDGNGMRLLEQVAEGAKVHPAYFAEWRHLWLLQRLEDALVARPNVSVGLIRKYAGFDDEKRRRVG